MYKIITASALLCISIPASATILTIGTNTSDWQMSTERASGGTSGNWTTFVPEGALPDSSTFTLTPSTSVGGHIAGPANILGVTPFSAYGGNNTATGVQFFKTSFEYYDIFSAVIETVFDNNMQIFINGQEVAREWSFSGANWNNPFPTLTINSDGSITNVAEFDQIFSFTGWVEGMNELVLAVRNPDNEGGIAGGVAFKMTIDGSETPKASVPEPASALLLALGAIPLLMRRRRISKTMAV